MSIIIKDLYKNYGKKNALNNVNMHIEKGMFGLLGPNGAGKTTLMRILTTLISKSSGEITMNNIDIKNKQEIRKMIGYLPQDFAMYPSLTVYEAMDYLAILSGVNNGVKRKEIIVKLLEQVHLENSHKKKVKALSGGMNRRLGIAAALINNPRILIVDEPTAGLDPEQRIRFRNLLRDFSEDRTVILSTHIVEDVEFTCENLAILNQGNLLYNGKVKELLDKAEGKVWSLMLNKNEIDKYRKEYMLISTVSEGEYIKAKIISEEKPFLDAISIKPTIEDAYMYEIGSRK